jgi:hypothetical protein
MKRDLSKAINEYQRRFERTKTGVFYAGDYDQLREMSVNVFDLVHNSLAAGFMIGYRCAKREQKKGRKES